MSSLSVSSRRRGQADQVAQLVVLHLDGRIEAQPRHPPARIGVENDAQRLQGFDGGGVVGLAGGAGEIGGIGIE